MLPFPFLFVSQNPYGQGKCPQCGFLLEKGATSCPMCAMAHARAHPGRAKIIKLATCAVVAILFLILVAVMLWQGANELNAW